MSYRLTTYHFHTCKDAHDPHHLIHALERDGSYRKVFEGDYIDMLDFLEAVIAKAPEATHTLEIWAEDFVHTAYVMPPSQEEAEATNAQLKF